MPIELLKDNYPGAVRTVTLGASPAEGGTRSRTVTVGGETALPFMHFEAPMPHPPVVAVEILDCKQPGWSPLLAEAWGGVMDDPAAWAAAAEKAGADLIQLNLGYPDQEGRRNSPEAAASVVRDVLEATGLPLLINDQGQADGDSELLVAAAEASKGERVALGLCEDKRYRTVVATAMANGHLVTARAPMDVNLSKQLNILITDMGMPLDRILMDPTTGALGYGIEYGYSVMERLRLAALQGDAMTQLPMIVTPGYEAWKTKEALAGEGIPASWGDWQGRALNWETLTAVSLLEAGADILVLRHPESIRRVKLAIAELMAMPEMV